jgi:cardiolipin synthase
MLGIGVCLMLGIRVEVKPSFVSKCTTVAQLFTVFIVLLYLSVPEAGTIPYTYATWLYVTTACLTIISGLHYIYMGMNINHQAEE